MAPSSEALNPKELVTRETDLRWAVDFSGRDLRAAYLDHCRCHEVFLYRTASGRA